MTCLILARHTYETLEIEATAMRLPRVQFTVRRLMIAVAVIADLLVAYIRAYRHFIPSGTDFYPYWSWLGPIQEGPRLASPDGRRVVQVMFNDAGAAHSGNHWTWLIVDRWLTGKRVIAEGYSSPNVRRGDMPFPSRWLDNRTLSMEFVPGRYGDRTPGNQVMVLVPRRRIASSIVGPDTRAL
jgi:hypothetical protein